MRKGRAAAAAWEPSGPDRNEKANVLQNISDTMRGLWDQERPVSPSLVRTALTFMGLLLAALAALNVLGGLGDLLSLRVGTALVKFTSGIAIPMAIWLGLRLLADLVILQNQTVDRLAALNDAAGVSPPAASRRTGGAKDAEAEEASMDDAV